jgi:BCD family chlorophyll transporter-like MFS transporter
MENVRSSATGVAEGSSVSTLSNLSLARNIKIALFHVGSSLADILALSVWNRIAIVELGLGAAPIALLLALRYLLAPLSIWVGQRSDVAPVRGYHRTPYIWFGRLLIVISFFVLGVSTVTLGGDRTFDMFRLGAINLAIVDSASATFGWIGLLVACLMFSIGSAFSGTTFLSLIHDITPKAQRTRAISVVWFFLIAGFAIAGIVYGRLLPHYTAERFLALFIGAALVMGALWFFTLLGEEKPTRVVTKAETTPRRPFMQDLRTVWNNSQTRYFFVFLALSVLFFYAQDSILEPFAGQVFNMPLATTSRFSAYWGSMTLIGIVVTLWIARRFPKTANNTTLSRWGVTILMITFVLFFVCAVAQIRPLVTIGLIVMGIGLGIWTVGTLGMMMDMTRAWGAGIYLALWTVSETLARGVGVGIGGIIRDVTLSISNSLSVAYGTVFLLEAIGFALTLLILSRVNVTAFQQQSPPSEAVLSAAMD